MTVRVRELAAWGFDRSRYRPAVDKAKVRMAKALVRERPRYRMSSPICEDLTAQHQAALSTHATRADLLQEVAGLDWSLAIVDLRRLLAFQRRLSFRDDSPATATQDDWATLFEIAFAAPKRPQYEVIGQAADGSFSLTTSDPNLHLRLSADELAAPLIAHGGSSFLEVARYRERWFLRDGYHRAYALLRAGIHAVPAVVVEARTPAELGAEQPQFFSEASLFSSSPPYVCDFLDDALTLRYERPAMTKTIRVTIRESYAATVPYGGTR